MMQAGKKGPTATIVDRSEDSEFSTDPSAPSFRSKQWVRCLSVLLSVVLTTTMFDVSGIASAFAEDGATTIGETQEAISESDSAAEEDPSQEGSAPETEENPPIGGGDGTVESGDPSGGALPDGDGGSADGTIDPNPGGEALSESVGEDFSSDADRDDAPVDEPVDPDDFLPEGLVEASEVLPQGEAGNADLSSRAAFSLTLFGASFDSLSGAYLVQGCPLGAVPTLGNLGTTLAGGSLGSGVGTVVMSLDAPYMIQKSDGSVVATLSAEEWKAEGGEEKGIRAILSSEDLPAGWTVWTEHGGRYLKRTAAELREGLSGRIVFRLEEDTLDGGTDLPRFKAAISGDAPSGIRADITASFEARGYSSEAGAFEDGSVSGSETIALINEEPSAEASFSVSKASEPVMSDDGGWLSYVVNLSVPSGASAASDLAIAVSAWADCTDRFGVPVSALAAFYASSDGGDPVKNDTGDMSSSALEGRRFVGVPGQGGAIVLDVTGLSTEQIASIDPADESSLEVFGLEPMAYEVSPDGTLSIIGSGAESGAARAVYVALPYAADALDRASDGTWGPVDVSILASAAFGSAGETLSQLFEEKPTFAEAAEGAEEPDEPESDGSEGSESDEDDPLPPLGPVEKSDKLELPTNLPLVRAAFDATLLDPYLQVDKGPGEKPMDGNTWLIKDGDTTTLSLQAQFGFVDGYLGGDPAKAPVFKLLVPYLYIEDATGAVQEVYTYAEWVQKKQENPISNSSGNDMFLSLNPSADVFTKWEVYDQYNRKITAGNYAQYYPDGLVGTFTLKYAGTNGRYQLAPGYDVPKFPVSFRGQIPENTGATVKLGASFTSYTDAAGIESTGNVVIDPGTMGETTWRTATFIKTNLTWGTEVECISEPVLWDRYNYMVYKVTTSNTSTTEDSIIDYFGYFFRPSSELPSLGWGLTQEDLLAWEVLPDGSVVPNEDFGAKGKTYIGKPKEGGVLVYDTTGWVDEDYEKLDLESFSNAEELGLSPLSYMTGGQDGQFTFRIGSTDPNDPSGNLIPKTEEHPDNRDSHTTIIAIPYTTNIPYWTNPSTGEKEYEQASLVTESTVYFGKRGENDYSWSQRQTTTSNFLDPKAGFEQDKWAIDRNSNFALRPTGSDRLGYMSGYVINNMKTVGNMPIFGVDSSTSYGAAMVDALPDDYQLCNIEISLPDVSAADPDAAQPALSDWYDEESEVVQFEIDNGDGTTSWESLGLPSRVTPDPSAGMVTWRIGGEDRASGIAEMLEARGIAAVQNKKYSSAPIRTFTGKFRILFKNRLPKETDIPGSIRVNGIMMSPGAPSDLQTYPNSVQVEFGEKRWIHAGDTSGAESHYETKLTLGTEASATLKPIGPVEPVVSANTYTNASGPADEEVVKRNTTEALLNEHLSGWRFDISNGSPSMMEPAYLTVGPMQRQTGDDLVHRGFDVSHATISKGLLENADIQRATITYYRRGAKVPSTVSLSNQQLLSYVDPASGNAVVPASAWDGGYFSGLRIDMASYKGSLDASPDAYVDVFGTPNILQKLPLTAEFSTNYENSDWNVSAAGTAYLDVVTIKPPTVVASSYTDASGPADESVEKQNTTEAPLNERLSGWRFDVYNNNETAMVPAYLAVGPMLRQPDGEANRGFNASHVSISKGLLENADIRQATVVYYKQGSQDPSTLTLTGDELLSYVDPASGNAVVPASAWDGGYFSDLRIDMASYKGSRDASPDAYVDVFGAPTVVQKLPLTALFSTDYENSDWNVSASGTAYLNVVTIEPKLDISYGWEDYEGAVSTNTTVPYRWGDGIGEKTWFDFKLQNESDSSADGVNLDASLDEVTVEPDGVERGFVPRRIEIAGFTSDDGSHASGVLSGIDLYDYGQTITGDQAADPAPAKSWSMDELRAFIGADGVLSVPESEWADVGPVKSVRVRYDHLRPQSTDANGSSMVLRVYGSADTHGTVVSGNAHSFVNRTPASAHFYPLTDMYGAGIERTASAYMPVGTFKAAVVGNAFKPAAVRPVTKDDPTLGDPLEVANKASGVGYRFSLSNAGLSRSDEATVTLSLDSVSNKLTGSDGVRGFKAGTVDFDAGLFSLGTDTETGKTGMKAVRFYFMRADGSTAALPDVTIAASDGTSWEVNDDGSRTVDLTSGPFASFADLYLKKIEIVYSEIDPASAGKVLGITVTGQSNWYNTGSSYLRATEAIAQHGAYDTAFSYSDKADLSVMRPALELHTYGQYAESDYTESSDGASGNSDGNRTVTTVPYDRDFVLWANIRNERSVSRLDDIDLAASIPLAWETGIRQDGQGTESSAWTGFHVTKMTVEKPIFDVFDTGAVGDIVLVGYAPDADGAAQKITKTLTPDASYVPGTAEAPSVPTAFYDADDPSKVYPVSDDGSWSITEEQMIDLGIGYLASGELRSWKNMEEDASAEGAENQNVVFNGYEDSDFNDEDVFSATSANHLEGFRAFTPSGDGYTVLRNDSSTVYISKMYFDAVSRSAYYDGGANRFDGYTTGPYDTHHGGDTYVASREDDTAIEVGYKAEGSFLADFRQVLNDPNQMLPEWTCDTEQGYARAHWETIGSKTYNSGARLRMTQTLPNEYFDAYYIKVRSAAVPYLKGITVNYADGSSMIVDEATIRSYADGSAESLQDDIDGQKYFRVNLLNKGADGSRIPDYGTANGSAYAYKDPFDDYADPSDPTTGDLVTSVVYELGINQSQYASGENRFADGTFDASEQEGSAAGVPDYGTWYGSDNKDAKSWIDNMAFEVTGRFYRESGTIAAETDVTMQVGGDYSGNMRAGHKAVVRYNDADPNNANRDREGWAYQNYHAVYSSVGHAHHEAQMRHLKTIARAEVVSDGNYTRKGVSSGLVVGNDGDTSVRFASDQKFWVSLYRKSSTGSSYGNWPAGRVSFADRITLGDTLPVCFPYDDLGYYGFLTTGMQIVGGSGVYDHLDTSEYPDASITLVTEQWVSKGDGTYQADATGARTFVLRADGMYQRAADGTETKVGEQGLNYLFANKGSNTDPAIKFERSGENAAAEIVQYEANGGKPVVVSLKENEFVDSYVIDLGRYGGSADVTSETPRVHTPDFDGTSADPDLYVLGRPYVYRGQKNPITGSTSDIADATNTMAARSYQYHAPDTEIKSSDRYTGSRLTDTADDQAHYLGYLIPYGYNYSLQAVDAQGAGDQSADIALRDYQPDNNTPSTAAFEVRFWNIDDGNPGVDDVSRATHISHVNLSSTMADQFRLQKVYVPRQLVPGDAECKDDWFRVARFSLTANGTVVSGTWDEMAAWGIVSDQPNAQGNYVVDVEKYLRDHPELTTTYRGLTTTNTLDANGFAGDPNVDLTYAKAHVGSIQLDFDSPTADREKPETMLDSGQYLAADRNADGYAFAYEGVYVDRTEEDFEADVWNGRSTPTFGKQGNAFPEGTFANSMGVSEVETKDPNHGSLTVRHADSRAAYVLSHLLGVMETSVERGREVELNGAPSTAFAYDCDDRSVTSPMSYDPLSGAGSNIPDGELYAGDYVEYLLYVGADEGSALPLEHVDARFETHPGQRIVGWEVAKEKTPGGEWIERNTTGLAVSAKITNEDGSVSRDADAETDLSLVTDQSIAPIARASAALDATAAALGASAELDSGTVESIVAAAAGKVEAYEQNRNLVFSLGEDAVGADGVRLDPDATQIQAGTGVYLRVITQMTDELETKAGYSTTENQAFNGTGDVPSYRGQSVRSDFYAAAAPKHDFVQHRITDQFSGTSLTGGNGVFAYSNDTGYGTNDIAYNRAADKAVRFEESANGSAKRQFGAQDYASVRFYNHLSDYAGGGNHYNDVTLSAEFTAKKPSTGAISVDDGNPMQLTVGNIKNPTWHAEDVTASVAFTDAVDAAGNPSGKRVFELIDVPRLAESTTTVKTDDRGDPVALSYPPTMPESIAGPDPANPGRPDIKVEYYDPTRDDGVGAWVSYADLEAIYGSADPDKTPEGHTANGSVFREVTGVRWTYYDVPATSDGKTAFAFDDVALIGVGRYQDVRDPDAALSAQPVYWTGKVQVDIAYTHRHNEATKLDFTEAGAGPVTASPVVHGTWLTKQDEGRSTTKTVYRRSPVMQFQNQVFQTEDIASADYDANADQKLGYVPGELFWYKDTLKNVPKSTNDGVLLLEGELYNPVFYERIPTSYLKTDANGKIDAAYLEGQLKNRVRWTNRDGNDVLADRTAGMHLEVSVVEDAVETASGMAPDYGGAMTYVSGAAEKGKPFSDMDPTGEGVSESTEFTLLKIAWVADSEGQGGSVVPAEEQDLRPVDTVQPENTRMEVGDTIELWFPVRAAIDGLPQVYLDLDTLGTGTAGAEPAYFPRIGEYYSSASGNVNPISTNGFSTADPQDGAYRIGNEASLMDMDALLHESAFSGDKAEQSDLWDMFDGSYTYIPGSSASSYADYGTSGQDGTYLDEDAKTARNVQLIRYTPQAYAGTVSEAGSKLPKDTQYKNTGSSRYTRDYYTFVTKPRTQGNLSDDTVRWGSKAPLVWSQVRVHLQKAWIATSSEFVPKDEAANYKSSRQYESGLDPHEGWYVSGTFNSHQYGEKGVVWGQHETTLQYNQDFTARLQALNYGDRTLDGVEYTYIMPRGIEPIVAEDGSIDVRGSVLLSSNGVSGASSDPVVNESWADIPSDLIDVAVVQSPYGEYEGYDAPSASQDPARYRDGSTTTEKDLSSDPSSTYESVASSEQGNRSEAYTDSSQPWVLKITVKQDLGKWFYRSADGGAANSADPDAYADGGYKINVDVPSHVFANNENGGWYDRVLVRPIDAAATGDDTASGEEPSKSSAYYQVLDIDHFEGPSATGANKNMQPYGMDYMWSLRCNSHSTSGWDFAYGSPNMPAVNGWTVQNNTVVTDGAAMGEKAENDPILWHGAYKEDAQGEPALYAQTGTRAMQRTPLVRTWNTVGADGVTGTASDYYMSNEASRRQLNVHVENRYWWDEYAVDQYYYAYERHSHNYSVDGGSMGDVVLPVVTTVLPYGIAPARSDTGMPYAMLENVEQPMEAADWNVVYSQDATADSRDKLSNGNNASDEQKLKDFTATVTYEEVEAEDGASEWRFVVRFIANGNDFNNADGNVDDRNVMDAAATTDNTEQRIKTNGMDTFKFDIVSYDEPKQDDAGEHEETKKAYENIRTYVSSKMGGFRFKSDTDIAGNPYQVCSAANFRSYYVDRTHDKRLDARVAVYRSSGSDLSDHTGNENPNHTYVRPGVIPYDLYDDGQDTVENVPSNLLPGFVGTYSELGTSDVANGTSIDRAGKGVLVEDYAFRSDYALSPKSTMGLNGNDTESSIEGYINRLTGAADSHTDAGAYSALKIRSSYPSFTTSYEVEVEPSDRPSDDPNAASGTGTSTGNGAVDGEVLDIDGGKTGDDEKSWQYDDTPWYSISVVNGLQEGAKLSESGPLNHAKLVFALHLPSQVSFYDESTITSGPTDEAAGVRNFADYEGDDYPFYVEYTHKDRHNNDAVVTEYLTPKQLIEQGWTVEITSQPNWEEDDFSQLGYAKPDADDPDDAVPDETTKPKSHSGEVLVFELAPPDDASDEEFDKYNSMLHAYWMGVRPDGYFGAGDKVTLKVKTRIDNLGSEGTALEGAADENGSALSYKEQLEQVRTWDGEGSQAYVTSHDRTLSWLPGGGADPTEKGWTHTYDNGTKAEKGKLPKPEDNLSVTDFKDQTVDRFAFDDRVEDAAGYTDDNGTPDDPSDDIVVDEVDMDDDGQFDDVYSTATAGWFKIQRPNASIRADTLMQRRLIADPDFTGVNLGDDSHQGGTNEFLITQAINTGGAVNSFIADWQIPYWATGSGSVYDAPFQDLKMAIGRIQPNVDTVSTGVWEVPGAGFDKYVDADGDPCDADAEGARPADDAVPNEQAETESKLRVYMLARVASNDPSEHPNGFEEQNGPEYIPHENFALPGTDADRDYYRGEDDADDGNNADAQQGTWVVIGDPNGYSVAEKVNHEIDLEAYLGSATSDVRQIRWVVKAGDSLEDDEASHETPVPHGFRLDIDAAPYDGTSADTIAATEGKQEADDVDPDRANVGWEWVKYEDGVYATDEHGNKLIQNKTPMPEGITDNAAAVTCNTFIVEDPVTQSLKGRALYDQLPERLAGSYVTESADDGQQGDDSGDGEAGKPTSSVAHVNHFVSAVPRYDDTKFAEAERSRAGFYRDPEYPYINFDMQQAYFMGSYDTEYAWSVGTPTIDPSMSRMMRYTMTLTNLSSDQLKYLGIKDGTTDFCTNPQISEILPFIEGFGAATAMSEDNFKYVDYLSSADPSCPLSLDYKDTAVVEEVPVFDEDGNPVYVLETDESGNPIIGPDGKYVYKQEVDEDGNPVFDEDGNPVYVQETDQVVTERAENLDDATPLWTYHVVDLDDHLGNPVPNLSAGQNSITLTDPRVGGSLLVEDKIGSVSGESSYNRKFMNWRFTGSRDNDGNSRRGRLEMGQAVVIELMMPIREDANASVSRDLLTASGYGYKEGNFDAYVPANQTGSDKISLIRDSRDVNLDGITDQKMVRAELAAVGFASNDTLDQSKYSTTQVNTLYTKAANGPAAAPEGTDYTYLSSTHNVGTDPGKAEKYVRATLFDVLPHQDDTQVFNSPGGEPVERDSQWNGWIDDLDSIKLLLFDPSDSSQPEGRVLDEAKGEAKIWVGPIKTEGDKLVPQTETSLPKLYAMGSTSEKLAWLNARYHDSSDLMRADGFVELDELKAYIEAHPDEAEKLKKSIRAVWAQVDDDKLFIPSQGYVRLAYDLHTPLNLPKYLGNLTGDPVFDMNLDDDNPDLNPDLAARLAETVQWNSFLQRVNEGGPTADANARTVENVEAGVFVDAPDERGYIGDYVWMDPDWNTYQDDTEGELTTDALGRQTTYHKGENGRWTLSTDKSIDEATGLWTGLYGDGQATAPLYRDVDFDGQAEDPGINGVKVELLNEYGHPVNRDGVVSVLVNDDKTNNEDRWVVGDAQTGDPSYNEMGGYISADAGEPYSFITESDYYDNKGYWIFSNLKPGKYKLRFTFPKEYADYSLTTKEIGPDDARTRMGFDRICDDPATAEDETALVATTLDPIVVEPVAYSPEAFKAGEHDAVHEAYDARMTSYDVGIARPVTYEGTVYRDDMLADGTEVDDDDVNGLLDNVGIDWDDPDPMNTGAAKAERRLGDMEVSAHLYDPVTDTVESDPALDAEGNPAVYTTVSPNDPEAGNFEFRLIPDR